MLRCTQILALAGVADYSAIRRDVLERKARLGSLVHLLCAMDDESDLDEGSVDELAAPYLAAWRRFRKESGFVPTPEHTERRVTAAVDGMEFSMQPDRVGFMGKVEVIADIKTTAQDADHHAIQLAGYAAGFPSAKYSSARARFEQRGRITVRLQADGDYRVKPYAEPKDLDVFMSALVVAQWKVAHGAKPKEEE